MKLWKFILLASLFAWFGKDGKAQQKQPVSSLQEDCGASFAFTTASSGAQAAGNTTFGSTGTTPVIDNQQTGCLDWMVTYSADTAVATLSLALQTATAVAGVPGTYSNYPGTINTGINPNTVLPLPVANLDVTGVKFPFVRMNMTIKTGGGTVKGRLYGWKRRPTYVNISSGGGCPGTIATPCVVVGPTAEGGAQTTSPVQVAGQQLDGGGGAVRTLLVDVHGQLIPSSEAYVTVDAVLANPFAPFSGANGVLFNQEIPYLFNGLTFDRQFVCSKQAHISLTDGTRTALVAVSGATTVRVCHLHASTTAAENWTISYGTGAACAAGTTTIDKILSSQAWAMDYQPTAALRGIASNGVCITQSAVQNAEVTVIYAQF